MNQMRTFGFCSSCPPSPNRPGSALFAPDVPLLQSPLAGTEVEAALRRVYERARGSRVSPARSTRILLVARQGSQSPLRRILSDAGYSLVSASSALAAFQAAEQRRPDLIVADPRELSSSDRDELSSFAAAHHIPIVFGRPDREALVAEVEGSLPSQEPSAEENQQLVAGPLRMDLAARVATLGETPLDLTAREFDLLCYFARHPGWVYSREELLEQVWGYGYADPQIVTVHVANLRKKMNAVAPGSQLIETVQKIGYRLAASPTSADTPRAVAPSGRPFGRSWKLDRTRIIVGSVVAAVAILVALGLGLGLGLRGDDGSTSASGVGAVGEENPLLSSFVVWGPHTVTEQDERGNVFWEVTVRINATLEDHPGEPYGVEIMNWSVTLPPPSAPPLGRIETADLVHATFKMVGDAKVATVMFRWDTTDWDHPGPPYEPYPPTVYHTFVLTDNPGSELDQVEGWTQAPMQPDPEGPWGGKWLDILCSGVTVEHYPASVDDANGGATSPTLE